MKRMSPKSALQSTIAQNKKTITRLHSDYLYWCAIATEEDADESYCHDVKQDIKGRIKQYVKIQKSLKKLLARLIAEGGE